MLKYFSIKRYTSLPEKKLAASIKNLFGFKPKNLDLFRQALRHSSVTRHVKQQKSNERLEFLGDSILNSIIADYLFKLMPNADEGFLTQARSRIVSRQQLNRLAFKMGIDKMLVADIKGHMPKSVSGNAFEALTGAIYLDQGYEKTKKIILHKIIRQHLDLQEVIHEDTDYKSRLINYCQKQKITVEFVVLSEEKDKNKKLFHIGVQVSRKMRGEARHASKRSAEQLAAMAAIEEMQID